MNFLCFHINSCIYFLKKLSTNLWKLEGHIFINNIELICTHNTFLAEPQWASYFYFFFGTCQRLSYQDSCSEHSICKIIRGPIARSFTNKNFCRWLFCAKTTDYSIWHAYIYFWSIKMSWDHFFVMTVLHFAAVVNGCNQKLQETFCSLLKLL